MLTTILVLVTITAIVVAAIYIGKFTDAQRAKYNHSRLLAEAQKRQVDTEADIRILVHTDFAESAIYKQVFDKWQGYFGFTEKVEYPTDK